MAKTCEFHDGAYRFAFPDGSTLVDESTSGDVAVESETVALAKPIGRKAAEALLRKAAAAMVDGCRLDWKKPQTDSGVLRFFCPDTNVSVGMRMTEQGRVDQLVSRYVE